MRINEETAQNQGQQNKMKEVARGCQQLQESAAAASQQKGFMDSGGRKG